MALSKSKRDHFVQQARRFYRDAAQAAASARDASGCATAKRLARRGRRRHAALLDALLPPSDRARERLLVEADRVEVALAACFARAGETYTWR